MRVCVRACAPKLCPFLKVEISVFSIVPQKKKKNEFLPNNQKKKRASEVLGDRNEAVLALWLDFLLSLCSSKGLGLG